MDRLKDIIHNLEDDAEFKFEFASVDVRTSIIRVMQASDVSRAELAARMGVSRARVSQILNGQDNLTLRTLVLVAHALGAAIAVSLRSNVAAPTRHVFASQGWHRAGRPSHRVRTRLAVAA